MAIVNRSKDVSEQQRDLSRNIEDTVTATSDQFYHCPHEMEIQSAKACAEGLSGSPTAQLQIQRFVTGAGETQIPLGPALSLVAVGTSGPQSFSFSSTSLQAGDQIVVTHAGANAAADQLQVSMVVKALQDIKSWSY
jgi:hypothetical protein